VYHKGATTVRAGGDWSPTFRLGTNNVLAPNFLALVFKKQEISQQDLASEFSKNFPGAIPLDPHSGVSGGVVIIWANWQVQKYSYPGQGTGPAPSASRVAH